MNSRILYKSKLLSLAIFLALFSFSYSQDEINGDVGNGYDLFQANCTACHQIDGQLIGPELRNVVDRVREEGGVGREWLHAWIVDNKALRESGDAYALEIFERHNQLPMNAFPALSEQDIDDILAYTSDPEGGLVAYEEARAEKQRLAEEEAAAKQASGSGTNGVIIVGFFILASMLMWILYRLHQLEKISKKDLAAEDGEPLTLAGLIDKYNTGFKLGLAAFTLLAFYGLWSFMIGIGVDKGYQPEQPIYFSHHIHAGVQGIDCQLCHSDAKYSKVSGIPSPDLCMNCHRTINEYKGDYYEEELVASGMFSNGEEVKAFYTEQIHKMYDAIGWNPQKNEYTGEQRPIEWIRIHNMPDFVYFSHQQHVVAGEKAILKAIAEGTIPNAEELDLPMDSQVCFACHGDVSKMEEVEMANDFTMGWCIECHRTTEVDMTNEYNSQYYADLHEKLKQEYGEGTKITVDAIGGMECAKCHY